eukprot:396142-Pelagomonas_calceolata.AAC.3
MCDLAVLARRSIQPSSAGCRSASSLLSTRCDSSAVHAACALSAHFAATPVWFKLGESPVAQVLGLCALCEHRHWTRHDTWAFVPRAARHRCKCAHMEVDADGCIDQCIVRTKSQCTHVLVDASLVSEGQDADATREYVAELVTQQMACEGFQLRPDQVGNKHKYWLYASLHASRWPVRASNCDQSRQGGVCARVLASCEGMHAKAVRINIGKV